MRVLVTRPQPDAARTAARLRELGHEGIVDSLLSIRPVALAGIPRGPFACLAATSANAVRVAAATVELDFLRAVPLYTAGSQTAEAARASGFRHVESADGDAATLARLLADECEPGARVLHLAGEDRAQELTGLLAGDRIAVELLVLYKAEAATAFGPATVAALSQNTVDAVLHFSLRSAATFAALAERAGLTEAARKPRHLCISRNAAEGLNSLGVAAQCAKRPTEAALLALLGS